MEISGYIKKLNYVLAYFEDNSVNSVISETGGSKSLIFCGFPLPNSSLGTGISGCLSSYRAGRLEVCFLNTSLICYIPCPG